ncbi:MAG: terminase TerL endonuclease subunit [Acutalibacteraceae bacterium]|nr:terminase TerL endonuclease subunit [Acutalibacteraceae bacterium]
MKKPKKTGDNWILTYYQGIKNGTYLTGRYITLLYEYLVEGLQNKQFFFDGNKANTAIEWIETHCFHTEGVLAPGALKLEVWQKAMISAIFGIVDESGYRHFREVLLVVSRKNGKSLVGSAIGNYTWRVDGGYGARVFCIAPKFDQADIIYSCIWQMVQLDPEWQDLKEKSLQKDTQHRKIYDDSMLARHRQTDLSIPGTNSTVKKLAFNSKSSDGFNPSLTLCDEVAAWQGDKGLKQYEVMKSGMGARPEGLLISCTTSGYVNDSIFDELMKRSTRFLMGESKEKRLLPLLYMIDDVEKWNDINELRKSNPNLGVSVSVDYLLEEIAVAEGSLSKKAEFITKYCCLKQNSSLAWLPAKVVEDASGAPLNIEDFAHSYCVIGLDLSQTRDLTACVCLIEKGGELYVFAKFFLPAERIDEATQRDGLPYNVYIQRGLLQPSGDNYIDYHDCYDWITGLIEQYEILPLMIGYDRYSAQYLIQDLESYGARCDDVFQGENLYSVIQETQGLLEDKKIHIGDNDLLKVHLLNSAIKMSTERGRGKLVKLSPSDHIDGTAALLDAMCVRQKWFAEIGEQLSNED